MGELERYGLLALLALTVLAVGFLLEEVRSLQGPEGVFELRADRVASAMEESGRDQAAALPETPGGGEPRAPRRPGAGTGTGTGTGTEVASEFNFFEPPVPLPGMERSYPEPPVQDGEDGQAAPSGTKRVQIQPNDTLAKIASRELDHSHRWREILPLNHGLDPARLQAGDWLLVPATRPEAAEASAPQDSEQRTHLVAKGDNFESIAQKYYSDRSEWMRIYEANRDVCRSPEKLRAGIWIVIP